MKSKQFPLNLVLLAEDDPDDAFFIQYAFEKAGLAFLLTHVANGEEVIKYLDGRGPYSDREAYPVPRLVVLDVNMPLMGGLEVLSWIKEKPQLKSLPVVMFSSSSLESEMARAIELGAMDYFIKPSGFGDLVRLVQTFSDRWIGDTPDPAPCAAPHSMSMTAARTR
jgi:CheY-like chemotaxis protein